MTKNLGSREEIRKLLTDYSTIGMTVAFSVIIGFGIGWWLDHKVFDDRIQPWCTFIGLAFGIFAGFRNLYQLAMRQDFKDDDSGKK
ncbi:MAG: AtpZ/AtpI family protein [Desulfobulbaceae bacterium]|nr:AtpZ/AtpI family protein [Desulfobulbaceae bacterium]HIJ79243.1 AtpZ/AtpI family protein [Deltaproteobacteria bacterium]